MKQRTRKCIIKSCRQPFKPISMTHKCCSAPCAAEYAKEVRVKKEAQEARLKTRREAEEKREHRKKVEALKPLSWFINRARTACHAYIKARDFGKSCICCGEPLDWHGDPQQIHAGHWRTQAAAGHLRFNEDNIHAQRASCNLYGAGRQSEMEQGMVERIGRDRVEALRCDNRVHSWTREELTERYEYFRDKLKELKKERE